MEKENEELLDNIGDVLASMVDEGSRYIQMYYAAYLTVTKIPPERVCLVHWERDGKSVWQLISEEEAYDLLNKEEDDEDAT